jgi:hypothetical protein
MDVKLQSQITRPMQHFIHHNTTRSTIFICNKKMNLKSLFLGVSMFQKLLSHLAWPVSQGPNCCHSGQWLSSTCKLLGQNWHGHGKKDTEANIKEWWVQTALWIGADGVVGNVRIAGKSRTTSRTQQVWSNTAFRPLLWEELSMAPHDMLRRQIKAQTASWDLRFIT